jgi:hypothetical protein
MAIDARTGKPLWQRSMAGIGSSPAMVVQGDRVIVGGDKGMASLTLRDGRPSPQNGNDVLLIGTRLYKYGKPGGIEDAITALSWHGRFIVEYANDGSNMVSEEMGARWALCGIASYDIASSSTQPQDLWGRKFLKHNELAPVWTMPFAGLSDGSLLVVKLSDRSWSSSPKSGLDSIERISPDGRTELLVDHVDYDHLNPVLTSEGLFYQSQNQIWRFSHGKNTRTTLPPPSQSNLRFVPDGIVAVSQDNYGATTIRLIPYPAD